MSKKLVVIVKNLTDSQYDAIRRTAERLGWRAEICDDLEEAIEASRDAEVVFGDTPRLTFNAPELKWVCSPSAGVNHFTRSEEFMKSGIMLSNSSGAYGTAISEHILMVTLALLHRLPEYQEKIASKEWFRRYMIRSIRESRVTVLGTGDIGKSAAVRLRSFVPDRITGMNTTGTDDSGLFDSVIGPEGLDEVLPETDILIMALPLTLKTAHLMNAERLAKLPDGALIVNVGRGGSIDQDALTAELKAGRLYAALDVFEKEPLPDDSDLWDCRNLLITPHVSGNMLLPYTVQKIVDMFLEDFEIYAGGGTPLRAVDLRKGY